MTNTVLVTRARGDEEELTEALHAKGLHVIHEPLTEIFLLHTARQALAQEIERDPDALIVTSRHGARALAALTELRDLPLLCVGVATMQAAQATGFNRAYLAGQTVQELIDYVQDAYDNDARLLYVSAQDVRADLVTIFAERGMEISRVVVYEAQAAERLSDVVCEQLKRGYIDTVMFLSQRSAQIFGALLEEAKLEESIAAMRACVLSETIANALQGQPWQAIDIADEPTLASILDCVDNARRHDRA